MMKLRRRVTKGYFCLAKKHYAPLIQKAAISIGIDFANMDELKSHADEELIKCLACYDGSGLFITFFYHRSGHRNDHKKKCQEHKHVTYYQRHTLICST